MLPTPPRSVPALENKKRNVADRLGTAPLGLIINRLVVNQHSHARSLALFFKVGNGLRLFLHSGQWEDEEEEEEDVFAQQHPWISPKLSALQPRRGRDTGMDGLRG